ncbi:MAG: response regulator [Verrucomicrobiales bacterium]|nr:response regulator [Verrucomicrobiales bacterium]
MKEKILFVDDEVNLLNVYRAALSPLFEVDTAASAEVGLASIRTQGPYAVVVSDRHMPGMNGVEFLTQVKALAPDSVRMMLTAYADLASTIEVVNEANLFRFLTKPCKLELLIKAVADAVNHHRLIISERELLEKTLSGSIQMLVEILSMMDPQSFGRSQELRQKIGPVAKALGAQNIWELEAAALLSRIGFITMPPSVAQKSISGEKLSEAEQALLARVPSVGEKLLIKIPRLEHVAKIVLYQRKHFDGTGFPDDQVSGAAIPLGARILLILDDYLQLIHSKIPPRDALDILRQRTGHYDPRVLVALARHLDLGITEILSTKVVTVEIPVQELRIGDVLESDLETQQGMLLLTSGHLVTVPAMERIRNFMSVGRLKEPILVRRTRSG